MKNDTFEIPAGAKLYRIRYRYQGDIHSTVVTAMDEAVARQQFRRDHPHVEIVTETETE